MKKNKKGSALAYGLIMMAVVSIILVSLLRYISSQMRASLNRGEKEQAFQVAEAGVYFYRWYLAHQVSGKTVQQIKTFWETGDPYGVDVPYEAEFFDPEGGAIGKYRIEVQPPEPDSTIVMVRSTGWTYNEPNIQRVVQARFRRPSWSEFAVIANDVMRFGEDTQVFGKVHSNDGIRFDGVAHNIVSSSMDKYDDPDHSGGDEFGVHTHIAPVDPLPPNPVPQRVDIFQAGRQFPLPTVDFNGLLADLNNMKTESKISGHGLYFDETGRGRKIILKSNDTFDICTVETYDSTSHKVSKYKKKNKGGSCSSCSDPDCFQTYPIPNNGVIFVENNIWVEGRIDSARLTIVAANLIGGTKPNVYIGEDNLLYTNSDGKDIIGLIAQQDISVVRDSLNDLTVDAALLAQSGRVGRDYYSSVYNKDSITVNGSIATNLRYGFAYTDGTGYHTRILNFDNNLLYYPPPYFPTGTEYSIDLWDEL
ncbi:MAG: pilus assembly PilX N-terminal domain-containing protein [Candidatus Moranbacteria bacterium]|nr:pilus assembly PilX N-terminal domain-containing protein [Candidatus Moranbacteria bacterium]